MKNTKAVIFRRFIAFVIDWNVVFLISIGLFTLGPRFEVEYLLRPSIRMFSAYGVILGILAFIILPFIKDCLFKGASLGKLICGIKVYDNHNKETAKTGALILRNITFYIPFVEMILCLCNKGRTLGDMVSSSHVDIRKKTQNNK